MTKTDKHKYSFLELDGALLVNKIMPEILKNVKRKKTDEEIERKLNYAQDLLKDYLRRNKAEKRKKKVIIDCQDDVYTLFVEVALSYCNPWNISNFLTYQVENLKPNRFSKDRYQFVYFIKNIAYNVVQSDNPVKVTTRLNAIKLWVEREMKVLGRANVAGLQIGKLYSHLLN